MTAPDSQEDVFNLEPGDIEFRRWGTPGRKYYTAYIVLAVEWIDGYIAMITWLYSYGKLAIMQGPADMRKSYWNNPPDTFVIKNPAKAKVIDHGP